MSLKPIPGHPRRSAVHLIRALWNKLRWYPFHTRQQTRIARPGPSFTFVPAGAGYMRPERIIPPFRCSSTPIFRPNQHHRGPVALPGARRCARPFIPGRPGAHLPGHCLPVAHAPKSSIDRNPETLE